MIDPLSVLDGLFAGLGDSGLPTLPTPLPTTENLQGTDNAYTSHNSHRSHNEIKVSGKKHDDDAETSMLRTPPVSRVASSYAECVGSVGSVGSGAKSLAESTPLSFPQDLENVGSVGRELAAPLSAAPLPISPADVQAGVTRELRALAEDGRESPAALRDAVEITRAKIRNSEALAERQANGAACHVCDGVLDDSSPVVAVLSGKRGSPLFLHAGCCPAYTARRIALVDRIMVAAGYGADERTGEAA